jgi:hypothetical protein
MRHQHLGEQHEHDMQASEEARQNRLRVAQLSDEQTVKSHVSPKTQGNTVREKQHVKHQTKPMRYVEKRASRRSNLWRELITDNPMYQKETLSSRRAIELQTPIKRFWKRALPLLFLASIYLCIYVFIINVYNNAYQEFIAKGGNIRLGISSPDDYARYTAWYTSAYTYALLLIIQFFVTVIGIPAMAINKITAERERMNWDSLLLSRMTPVQVLVGKVAPVLKTLLKVNLALLPALAITAIMARSIEFSDYNKAGISLRGFILPQVCLFAASVLNITIAMYYSLKEKQSAKAALGAGRWFAIPTLGAFATTGIFYTIYALFQMATGSPQTITDEINFLLWLPNIINPLFVLFYSCMPIQGTPSSYYFYWYLLPYLYPIGCAIMTHLLCKKMMKNFQKSPKDASG